MKNYLFAVLFFISVGSSAQVMQSSDSTDTVTISKHGVETLLKFEESINRIRSEQEIYLRGLVEQCGLDFDAIRNRIVKFENGKIIYTEE